MKDRRLNRTTILNVFLFLMTATPIVIAQALPSSKTVRGSAPESPRILKKNTAMNATKTFHQDSKKAYIASSPRVSEAAKNHSPPSVKPLKSGIRVTVLAGGNSSTFDKHERIFFPAETFRADSFKMDANKINFASAIGVSYEKILDSRGHNPWGILQTISLGVNAYYHESPRNGSVYEYGLFDFNNASYAMKIKSYRIMLDTEWGLSPIFFGMMPFLEGGIGGAQNTLSFKNTPRPNIGADGGYYKLSNHTTTHFAYQLGAGLKMPVNDRIMLSARYLFANTGAAKSGISDANTGVILASPVRTDVQSQSVLFGLSYLFG